MSKDYMKLFINITVAIMTTAMFIMLAVLSTLVPLDF